MATWFEFRRSHSCDIRTYGDMEIYHPGDRAMDLERINGSVPMQIATISHAQANSESPRILPCT